MKIMTIEEVAARFHELAQQEKWFDIQDELFSEDVKSIEPVGTTRLHNEQGKSVVRKKGEAWVARIEELHGTPSTTAPIIAGNHFAVARKLEVTVSDIGRIKADEIMLYEVKDGRIVSEQFFY